MIPAIPKTLYQRISIWHLQSGNAICVLLNRDGTWRVPPFMLYAPQSQPTKEPQS